MNIHKREKLEAAVRRRAREAARDAFDAQVLPLSRLGLNRRAIAARLNVTADAILHAEERLVDSGQLNARPAGRAKGERNRQEHAE